MSGRLYSNTVTCHSAAVADANGTVVDCSEMPAVAFQIGGTVTTATLYFEGTLDGSSWVALYGRNAATGAVATSTTAAGIWIVDCIGLSQVRCRLDWTAGSVNVYARAVAAPTTAWTGAGYVTAVQGTAAAALSGWPTKDDGPAWTSSYLHTASADATGGADLTAAPTSGQKIVIDDVIVSVDTAMKVILEEEASGTDVIVLYMPANSVAQVTPRGRIKLSTADKKLRLDTSVAGNIAVTVVYHSEA